MSKLRTLLLTSMLVLTTSSSASGQEPAPLDDSASSFDPETGLVLAVSELTIPAMDLADGWLELTPLATDDSAVLIRLGELAADEGGLRLVPGVPAGAAMLCTAGRSWAVLCEQVFIPGEVWVAPDQPTDVEVRFETGIALTGRYLLDGWPLAGARVAVVPVGLATRRAFSMPLGLSAEDDGPAQARREVESDAEGRFDLPRLAAGEYFLETLLPSGRVHRTEPFLLPARETARRETGAGASSVVVWDLGEIDVADGLVVAFSVSDPAGEPLAGARVAVRQGMTPETLIRFEAATDAAGEARLSGFSVDEPVHLSCRMPGYRIWRREDALLPVVVDCALEPLAAVAGEVVGTGGSPLPGAEVAVIPKSATLKSEGDSEGGSEPPRSQAVDEVGVFALGDLPAGDYRLTAAAPGHEVATASFTLDPGQQLILEPFVLSLGRELSALVVDAESEEPVAGVAVRAVSPPGAVSATSDSAGRFTFATRSDEPLVLALSAPEHVRREVTVSIPRRPSREPLRFELERGGWIRAVVWDEAIDLPCQGCGLRIEPTSARLTTDGLGEATSEPLAPGDYRVYRPRVLHRGSAVISQEQVEYRSVRVRRGKTSTVRFGQRQQTVRVVFEPAPGPGWALSVRTARRFERFSARADGSFHVGRHPGEHEDLYLHRYDPATRAEVEIRQAAMPATFDGDELVLPLAGTLLTGRGWSEGAPIAGEQVQLMTLERQVFATARTRPDGTFSVPHVPPGVYAVMIGRVNVHFVSLRAGQALDLGTLELIAGGF